MASENSIRLTWGGDAMCLGPEITARILGGGVDMDGYVDALSTLLSDSDYAICNLETPICPSLGLTDESIRFNSPRAFAEKIKSVGFDFVSTANNHCLDREIAGIDETIKVLNEIGLEHSGTYSDRSLAGEIFVNEIKGVKFAIVCSTFGTNSQHNGIMLCEDDEWRVDLLKKQVKPRRFKFNPDAGGTVAYTYLADDVSPAAITNPINFPYLERVKDKVRKAKTIADVVIAMPHIGGQFNPGPGEYAKYIVREMRDAGADMIIAGHPHTSHRCEWVDGAFCAYSLGNLCFTPNVGYYVPNTLADYGIVLHTDFDVETKKLSGISFSVVKSVRGEDGKTSVIPVVDLYSAETNLGKRETLVMENEAVVNRFIGSTASVDPQHEYVYWEGI